MMDWNGLVGKKFFFRTKSSKVYTGTVKDVDTSSPPLIFITLKDKFAMLVTLVHSEIVEMKEE